MHRCYIGKDKRTLPINLQITIKEEEYYKWIKEEIDQQLREKSEFYL